MLIVAELLAGLGLLFVGLRLLSTHLQQATGRKVRTVLKAATRSPLAGFASGALAGIATQSSNAVAVIAGNLVRGGVFATRDAVAVVAGANVGTSALVFVAAIDFRTAVLLLVALVGFALHFRLDRQMAAKEWLGAALGLALLFLGLDFIKTAPRHLDVAAMAPILAVSASAWIAFGVGLFAAFLTQSSSTAAILTLAAVQAQILSLDGAFFMVLGANLGSGLSTLVSAGGLTGTGRQLCYVHILVKVVGCLVLFLAWKVEEGMGKDLATLISEVGHHEAAAFVSVLFLALQLAGGIPVALLRGPTERIAALLSPPTVEDGASQPRFINERALGDPASALDLLDQEARRLVSRLPQLLPDLDLAAGRDGQERIALWRGGASVALTADNFLKDVIDRGLGREDLDRALHQQAVLETVRALQDALHDFSEVIDGFDGVPPLAFRLSESLRAIVFSLSEAVEGGADDFDLIIALTADRSEMLNKIRRALASSLGVEEDARQLLLATSLFERAVWLVRRSAVALRPAGNDDKSAEAGAA